MNAKFKHLAMAALQALHNYAIEWVDDASHDKPCQLPESDICK